MLLYFIRVGFDEGERRLVYFMIFCVSRGHVDIRGVAGGVVCQAEDGIRDLVRSRGLGDVYKRQILGW